MTIALPEKNKGTLPIVPAADPTALSRLPALPIAHDPWQTKYDPQAEARVAWLPGEGLYVHLSCREADPIAQETEPDSGVWMDSCMECFINFRPQLSGTGYLNFEINANGAMLAAYGTGRHGRTFLKSIGLEQPEVALHKGAEGWSASFVIGIDLIRQFYGIDGLNDGDQVAANFYKCGTRTPVEHYLCWSYIQADHPDFHLPEWFGTLTVKA